MIKKIIIDDFQSWEHLELEPSPHLSVIIGTSNQGKTGIARALSACIYGEWDTSWVRFGKSFCKITVILDNGISVTRRKGPKINEYILTIPNCEDQIFSNFGVEVPPEIQRAFNMYKVPIVNGETINFGYASQLDPLFMLGGSKSFNAKILGKLTGADVLDMAIQSLNKEKRQTTGEKSSKEQELVELQAQIDKLSPIESYSGQIIEIEARLVALSVQEARLERIRDLFRQVKALKVSWDRQTAIEALISQIDTSTISELALKVDKIKAISSLLNKRDNLVFTYTKQCKLKELLTSVDLSIMSKLSDKSSSLKLIKDLSIRIGKNKKELVSKTDELAQVEQKYQETKEQYSVMLKENGVCPICGVNTGDVCVS